MNLYTFFEKKYDRKEFLRRQLGDFAHENRELLIIVADSKTDYIFCAYKDRMTLGQIKSMDGSKMKIIKTLLSESSLNEKKFNTFIAYFTASLIDVLKVGVDKGNHFYQFIDGSIHNIIKVIYSKVADNNNSKPNG